MTHWYDYAFWMFMGGGALFILGVVIWMVRESIRDRRPRTSAPSHSNLRSHGETWGLGGGTDASTGFDVISSNTGGSDSSSSDSGGGFESGGGDFGGGGSSGGWND